MTMQCIRCHAEDTEPARFCRQCGYPYVFDELIHCPVCGGEVRHESKVCPGCQHVFALPVALAPESISPRRHRSRARYIVPAIAVFALAGGVFFYGLADREIVQARPAPYARLDASVAEPVHELRPEPVVIAPASVPAVVQAEPDFVVEEPKAVPTPARSRDSSQERREPRAAGEMKPQATATKETPKADASAGSSAASSGKMVAPAAQIDPRGEAIAPVLSRTDAVSARDHAQPAPLDKSKLPETPEARETKEAKAAGVAERTKASTRGAPVVERSKAAEPSQISRLVRERDRRLCEGRWEGECRQFPDHKPNW